jgi:hypothetical protein
MCPISSLPCAPIQTPGGLTQNLYNSLASKPFSPNPRESHFWVIENNSQHNKTLMNGTIQQGFSGSGEAPERGAGPRIWGMQ